MLDAVAIATWIAICTPAADAQLATVLVQAGSAGEPYLVTDAGGETFVGKSLAEAAAHARKLSAAGGKEFYLGLAQVPLTTLEAMGMAIEDGLDKCGSLELGYEALMASYEHARTVEKTPAKTVAAAFSHYRSRTVAIDLPYAKKAAELSLTLKPVAPAPLGSRRRAEMLAEWAAGFAQRLGQRAARFHDAGQRAATERTE